MTQTRNPSVKACQYSKVSGGGKVLPLSLREKNLSDFRRFSWKNPLFLGMSINVQYV